MRQDARIELNSILKDQIKNKNKITKVTIFLNFISLTIFSNSFKIDNNGAIKLIKSKSVRCLNLLNGRKILHIHMHKLIPKHLHLLKILLQHH